MKEKFIAKVPETLIIQPPQMTSRTAWSSSYNVACWVRLQQQRPCRMALLLKFVDQEGITKQLKVDQCSTELSVTMLLSGQIPIPATGRIIDMGVYLESSDGCPPHVIDELFVQCIDKASSRENKLISSAA